MSKSNATENDFVKFIFNNVAMPNYGATTFAAHFVGGTVSDIVTDTANGILRRADRPVRRYGELTLGAVV